WPQLAAMADWLSANWDKPDRGIWELRSTPRPLLSSKLGCWVALRTLVDVAQARNPLDLDAVWWHQTANEIAGVLEAGLAGGGAPLDAALLRLAWQGPWPANHPLVLQTVDRLLAALGDGPFVRRYPP